MQFFLNNSAKENNSSKRSSKFTDVPTFLGHPVYYIQHWKQFSRCEELTRLSSSLDTSLSLWMVRRFRMKRTTG